MIPRKGTIYHSDLLGWCKSTSGIAKDRIRSSGHEKTTGHTDPSHRADSSTVNPTCRTFQLGVRAG